MDKKTNIKDIIEMAGGLDYINPKDIPTIDLYMDQLTTFMEEQIGKNRRNDEDKVMTKTMINNYTKNKLLPSPNKKKYSKKHLILLIHIYYLKNMLSINDIHTLLEPLIDDYFETESGVSDISDIYEHLYKHLEKHYGDIIKDIVRTSNKADEMYDPEKDTYLHNLSLISLLSVDIYVKKKYVEHLVDQIREESEAQLKAKEDKEKASQKAKTTNTKSTKAVKSGKAATAKSASAAKGTATKSSAAKGSVAKSSVAKSSVAKSSSAKTSGAKSSATKNSVASSSATKNSVASSSAAKNSVDKTSTGNPDSASE
jgi:hypothetical protein